MKHDVATCGTLESNDVMVTITSRAGTGLDVEVDSIVLKQFGARIEAVVRETAAELGLDGARVAVQDKGAYDCTIRARVEVAARRFLGGGR